MRRLVLALLLSTPLAASAQYILVPLPPPPPVRLAPVRLVPVPPPPPPPVYVAPRPPAQSPFYLNLGIGGGVERSWDAWGYWSTGGLAYNVEVGLRLAPQLLVGFDLLGLSIFGNAWEGTSGSTLLHYDAVLTLFPFTRGFYLRGGGGLSTLTFTPPYSPSITHVGSNALIGGGWAFPVAPPLHVTVGMDWTWNFFGAIGVAGSGTWMARVGIGFY